MSGSKFKENKSDENTNNENEETAIQDRAHEESVQDIAVPDTMPYKSLMDRNRRLLIDTIIMDHMLFSCATSSAREYAKLTRAFLPRNLRFFEQLKEIKEYILHVKDPLRCLKYIMHNFNVSDSDAQKLTDLHIKVLFLQQLKEQGNQAALCLVKQLRMKYEFVLDVNVYSLIGYTAIKNDFYSHMVSDERMAEFVDEINSVLWCSKFGRKCSLLMWLVDGYDKNK
ncbi:hypothetical protein THOM_0185 [Trachipleistophora hominis]|uniref:Uncharacterized protein n=1 Tax=Trachipleistophora hominis TaxID=72359 RepID=L7K0A2_TRAHO|nr:hypothetical protein THOM_0185 [Trachipleistophora hominis]